jgi:hypothetical protein
MSYLHALVHFYHGYPQSLIDRPAQAVIGGVTTDSDQVEIVIVLHFQFDLAHSSLIQITEALRPIQNEKIVRVIDIYRFLNFFIGSAFVYFYLL